MHEHGHGHVRTPIHEQAWTGLSTLVDILREQLQVLREELQEARAAAQERERDYREHIARLTAMLDQAHQQNQRLLDLPRTPAAASPQEPRGAAQPSRRVPRAHPRRQRLLVTRGALCVSVSWRCYGSIRRA